MAIETVWVPKFEVGDGDMVRVHDARFVNNTDTAHYWIGHIGKVIAQKQNSKSFYWGVVVYFEQTQEYELFYPTELERVWPCPICNDLNVPADDYLCPNC
jgi:hypothetical protein